MSKKIIIDTDAGLDDAQAILMALSQADVDVIAITTVHGNTEAHQVSLNVLRLLRVAGRLDIPVYTGASKSLVGDVAKYRGYHGNDGFGDAPDEHPVEPELIQNEHAVLTLVNLVNKRKDLSMVCLGPLTNVALALHIDPEFGKKLQACYVMGGNYSGRGNVTCSAEFNFHADPEAARMVLADLGRTVTLASWDLCLKTPISWKWREELFSSVNAKTELIKQLEAKTLATYYVAAHTRESYQVADQMAVAILINSAVVKRSQLVHCTVETTGSVTRGQMVVDWRTVHTNKNSEDAVNNVDLIMEVDRDLIKDMIEKSFLT